MRNRILLVEDDKSLLEMISLILEEENYLVNIANSAELALEFIKTHPPDIILLDIILPGMNGYQFCETIRQNTKTAHIPILMLSQKDSVDDIAYGLDSCADDYIPKPFNNKILLSRIKALLRRSGSLAIHHIRRTLGNTIIDNEKKTIYVNKVEVRLTKTLYDILFLLTECLGRFYTKQAILKALKGGDLSIREQTIQQYIYELRKALSKNQSSISIINEKGFGYKATLDTGNQKPFKENNS